MTSPRNVLLATLIAFVGAAMSLAGANAAAAILSGTITSAAGTPMPGPAGPPELEAVTVITAFTCWPAPPRSSRPCSRS